MVAEEVIPSMFNFFDDKSHHVTVILRLALVDKGMCLAKISE